MSANYYSISEFKKLDINSMKSIILKSYYNDAQRLKINIQNEYDSNKMSCDNFVELSYFIKNIEEHIIANIDYYDFSLLCNLYNIYLRSKNNQLNVFYFINNKYQEFGKNICLTKTSDIISLFIKIKNDL